MMDVRFERFGRFIIESMREPTVSVKALIDSPEDARQLYEGWGGRAPRWRGWKSLQPTAGPLKPGTGRRPSRVWAAPFQRVTFREDRPPSSWMTWPVIQSLAESNSQTMRLAI